MTTERKKRGMIAASMMCSRLGRIHEELKLFEQNQMDYLHIDVMDGEFVPNLGLGVDYIRELRELTRIPLDLHLMINRPEDKLDWFGIQPQDIVSIHYESTRKLRHALEKAHVNQNRVFLAISPGTSVQVLEEVLGDIDGINLLMVDPGFAGQRMRVGSVEKAAELIRYLEEREYGNLTVEVDGNITFEHAGELYRMGAELFVAGISSIYRSENILGNIRILKNCIKKQF